jgi:hypothetical protein
MTGKRTQNEQTAQTVGGITANLALTDIQARRVYGRSMFVTLGSSRIPSNTIVVVCYENTGAVYGSIFLRARWVAAGSLCQARVPTAS